MVKVAKVSVALESMGHGVHGLRSMESRGRFRNNCALGGDAVTHVLITIDTELSAALFQAGHDADSNCAFSIDCNGFGIHWQMDRLEACGLTGVFFVDPMPALVYGPDIITRIVAPIVARGHEAQLHLHPEWLEWSTQQPVGDRRGRSIGDFDHADQRTLIALARQLLIDAGAPPPTAFRAGNYGANDDTLRVLAELGMFWDSSFNPAYVGDPCHISLAPSQIDPVKHLGITEVPVSAIHDRPGHVRHAQVCALSSAEMNQALKHAAATQRPAFTIVTHSFEMMSRDRKRPNRTVMKRFETLCHSVAADPDLSNSGFSTLSLSLASATTAPTRLPPNYIRTARRMAAQALATLVYER
jgi:peptidoglycan/xylan/chitin deacetylase (PgdA/CDA1 family)